MIEKLLKYLLLFSWMNKLEIFIKFKLKNNTEAEYKLYYLCVKVKWNEVK